MWRVFSQAHKWEIQWRPEKDTANFSSRSCFSTVLPRDPCCMSSLPPTPPSSAHRFRGKTLGSNVLSCMKLYCLTLISPLRFHLYSCHLFSAFTVCSPFEFILVSGHYALCHFSFRKPFESMRRQQLHRLQTVWVQILVLLFKCCVVPHQQPNSSAVSVLCPLSGVIVQSATHSCYED